MEEVSLWLIEHCQSRITGRYASREKNSPLSRSRFEARFEAFVGIQFLHFSLPSLSLFFDDNDTVDIPPVVDDKSGAELTGVATIEG
jgi:hypothetical protein